MLSQIMETDKQYYMNTFGARTPVCFDYGKGLNLYTKDGEEYYDFFAGIAVTALGHSHPKFVKSITEQAGKLLHTSSIYYIEKQAQLAKLLVENSCADKAFLCSTGAEANEGAIKLAKIYFYKQGKENKNEIITLKNSFHGRTLATVAATGQEKYQKPYKPLTPGFKHVEINDFDALVAAVNENTAAIMMEPVQGESGVHPAKAEYLKKVRQLCDEKEIILIFDEVQTGMGRTGIQSKNIDEYIQKLKKSGNPNASKNSAHCYATTFDITYARYDKIKFKKLRRCESVEKETLKNVLGEVLRDLRKQNKCYVKYEVKQRCFHVTTRI